jgi:hypothetical protein
VQAEHIGTKLAEIDAVIVPAAPDLPPFTLAEGPQGDVECLQGWSTTGGWRPESRPAFLRQGTDRPNASHMRLGRGVSDTRRRRTACSCGTSNITGGRGLAIVRTPNCSLAILLYVVKLWHSGRRYAPAGLIEYLNAGGPVVAVAPARHRATPAPPPAEARARPEPTSPRSWSLKLLMGE